MPQPVVYKQELPASFKGDSKDRTCSIVAAVRSGGSNFPASPHPATSPLLILTKRKPLPEKEDWESQSLAWPDFDLNMKTSLFTTFRDYSFKTLTDSNTNTSNNMQITEYYDKIYTVEVFI